MTGKKKDPTTYPKRRAMKDEFKKAGLLESRR